MTVGRSARKTINNDAKNFAKTIVKSPNGRVSNNSIVPVRFSSANTLIVIAGIKKRKTHGAIINRESILAYPVSSMLNCPENTHSSKPIITKKTDTTTYPMSELKK